MKKYITILTSLVLLFTLSIPTEAANIKETVVTDETFYTPHEESVNVYIGEQTVKYIADGTVLFECKCVTGNDDGKHNTPYGTFKIQTHNRGARLRGPSWDCTVAYWMKFTDDGCGFLDATWRGKGEFGGNTYKNNGSHGCVNLSYDDAEKLFSYVDVGTVVHILP